LRLIAATVCVNIGNLVLAQESIAIKRFLPKGNQMPELKALEKLAVELVNCRNEAMSLGDNLLVYLLNMSILHVRKKSSAVREAAAESFLDSDSSSLRSAHVHYLPHGPTERILLSLLAPLSQIRNEVDSGCAKGRIADSQESG
jgi:hypothetical protein